jgi:hypothetical protein
MMSIPKLAASATRRSRSSELTRNVRDVARPVDE